MSDKNYNNLENEEIMKIKSFHSISEDAIYIRKIVFEDEQGFRDEFDEIDKIALHMVMYNQLNEPIATCRVFAGKEKDSYLLGRLAVVKSYRGKKIGSKMIEEAEKAVKEQGGKNICLHSQCRAKDFYAKCGYMPFGEEDEEEGCPHIWMKKSL